MPFVLSQNSFGLVPKVFNVVDVIFAFGKVNRMVDAVMAESAHVKRVVGPAGSWCRPRDQAWFYMHPVQTTYCIGSANRRAPRGELIITSWQ